MLLGLSKHDAEEMIANFLVSVYLIL
jgi:hypothetical protein